MAKIINNIFAMLSIAALTLLVSTDAATPFRECNNGSPMPLMVQIDDCQTLPCDFLKGTQSNMAIQFVATKNSMSKLRADVRLSTLGAQLPFELDEERRNVCNNLMFDAYCPLDAGEDVTYHLNMEVIEQQPEVPVKVEVKLFDPNDNAVVACFITDGRVKRNLKLNKLK